jgi:CheY-like chemotaxis protein
MGPDFVCFGAETANMINDRRYLQFSGPVLMFSDSQLSGDLAPNPPSGQPSAEEALRAFESSGSATGGSRLDAHILVVDDELINVKVVQKFLGAAGYRHVSFVESGLQALNLLEREMPDLLLLDIFLADVNGIEVLKRLRALPGGKHLPVLVITASTDRDLERCALELGAIGFVTKPISHGDLIARLQTALSSGS